MVEKILRRRIEKKIETLLLEDQFGFGRRRGNVDSENNIITSLGHRRSLHFVAIFFFFDSRCKCHKILGPLSTDTYDFDQLHL
jgi:hypothetical protein